jgi:hypothetical protein
MFIGYTRASKAFYSPLDIFLVIYGKGTIHIDPNYVIFSPLLSAPLN